MIIVNGHEAVAGCYIDGHWGQYGPDQLADIAEGFGWRGDGDSDEYPNEGYSNDPRYWRRVADRFDELANRGSPNPDDERRWRNVALSAWESQVQAADAIEAWLNDHTMAERRSDGQPVFWHGQWYTDDGHGTPVDDVDVQRYVWHWRDGEFFLSPLCENGDCDDDTCAHWD